MKVSVLILTHNEAANLPVCLAALAWCDDVVVVDSGSTDDTVAIARHHGARVMMRPFDTFAAQRNFGLDQGELRRDWVLHLDADEVVTPGFVAALASLEPPSGIYGYQVPSKLMLFGRWLRHGGMYPTYQVRLGHRDRLRFKQVGHGQREDLASARIGLFPEPYLHFSFSRGMRQWLERHVRYAEDEAELILAQRAGRAEATASPGVMSGAMQRRRLLKALSARLPLLLRPMLRFLYVYLCRQGFRDGRAGLAYALMTSVYEGMIAVFAYERLLRSRERPQGSPPVKSATSMVVAAPR